MSNKAEDNVVIRNIYYMMAYAFRALDLKDYERLKTEDFEEVDDLLAAILAIGMASQQRRGYERGYLPEEEDLAGVRGRIDMRRTARNEMARRQKAHCIYDEFTEDTQKNRILKATARILATGANVDPVRRRDLKRCLVYMGGVSDIGTSRIDWKRLKYDRNNSGYPMLMNVCYMVLNGLVLSTEKGDRNAASFMDGQELYALYEKFLREYFRRHHPAVKVSAKEIDNGIENAPSFLPRLCTDITLEHGRKMLIIDAKCYGKILTLHYGAEKLSAANRNQILSYVLHAAYGNDLDVSGMLLYAQTSKDRRLRETWGELGHKFHCRTLDLNREFRDIAAELDEIASMVLGT